MQHKLHQEDKDVCTRCNETGIEEPLPQIPQSFVESFVKAEGKIDEVEVEYEDWHDTEDAKPFKPRLKLNKDNTINITPVEEKMYSKEEVMMHLYNLAGNIAYKNSITIDGRYITGWIKNNL